MTRKSIQQVVAGVLVACAAFTGCRHRLHPGEVCYPPVCSVDCPSLPLPSVGTNADESDPAKQQPVDSEFEVQPIDLPTALRIADEQSPQIALARERINEALAQQDRSELLWVPDLEMVTNWTRHDGQIQRFNGEVPTVSRSSAFVGGGPVLSLALSDAIFTPLVARQVSSARMAGAAATANEQLLAVAVAYIDLLQAYSEQRINEETLRNAQTLLKLTESHEKAGTGAPADTARSRTEVYRRERQRIELQGRVAVASARLVQLLNLPPQLKMQPLEPAVVPIALVPDEMPLDELLAYAIDNRPELAENRALIASAVEAWRGSKMSPWLPGVNIGYSAGGFGGGPNGFFGNFDARSDLSATLVWQLQNCGLGNLATMRERRSQYAQAAFRQESIETRVANELVAAFTLAAARRQELTASQREVAAARESYDLNADRIRRAPLQSRPIELLQAVQALAQARQDYLQVVADYDRAQFRLYTAMGNPPLCAADRTIEIPTKESTIPGKLAPVEDIPTPKPTKSSV